MTPSLRFVGGLLLVSLFGLAVTGQSIYARLSYLWILVIGTSFIFSHLTFSRIDISRHARRQRAQVGEVFEEVFELRNRGRFPLFTWIEIQDYSPLPGTRGSRVLTMIRGHRSRSYISRTRLVSRGVFPLGPTRLISGDLFGLFSVSREIKADAFLTVYPRVVPLHGLPKPTGLMPGGEALRRRTHYITPNASGVREYVPSDPYSRIHWRSTARRNRLIVKEFELDPLAEVWIFLDAEASQQAFLEYKPETDAGSVLFQRKTEPSILPSTEEYSATIVASLAQYYLRAGRSVGFVSNSKNLAWLPAERGGRQLRKILELLALLKADGDTSFEDLVLSQARHLPRGSSTLLITPSVRPDVLPTVEQLRRFGLRSLVILLDAKSFGGKAGSQELSAKLSILGMPQTCIPVGADLVEKLQELDPPRKYSLVNVS